MLLLLTIACAQPLPGSLPEHEGRPIAPVMGWQGGDWLKRDGREAEEATDRMLKQLKLEPGDRVADLGCGTGFHARRMKGLVGPQGVVHCVDLQPEMLARAGRLAAAAGVELSLVHGEASRIPLPDEGVDHLLMVDVYHELQDPTAMLAEMKRVLAPHGTVHFVEFRLEGATAGHIKREHRMALTQVQTELAKAGFEVVGSYDKLPSQHLVSARVNE
jgi:ubiquinone/menaquinone biosynthesis C-methylase UbiE